MAFVLKQSASYSWPVTIEVATDGGRREKHTFEAEFRRIGQERIAKLLGDAQGDQLGDVATCKEIVCGWSGVSDGEGELAFSDTALAQLLDIPGAAAAIIVAWGESLTGAPRKN